MAKNITIFGYSFTKKLFARGTDSYIIEGVLKFAGKKIASVFDDGYGGGMNFDVCISAKEWEEHSRNVANAYVTIGMYHQPMDNSMEILVHDLIYLEICRNHFATVARREGWGKQAIMTIYIEQEQDGRSLSAVCFDRPLPKRSLGDKAVKVLCSFPLNYIHVYIAA